MTTFYEIISIDKTYKLGEIQILPFQRQKPIDGLNDAAQCYVNSVLAPYKTIEGNPVDKAALIRYGSMSVVDDITEEQIDIVYELTDLACFCGLGKREYFNSVGPYCNSDSFNLYVQKFDKAGFTALTTRRREGRTRSGWPIDDISITIPVHCHTIRDVSLDADLLEALVNHRAQLNDGAWGKWQNAISSFNQANTDSGNIRHQIEWVLLCGAFEHILEADSKAKDVAFKFTEVLVPSKEFLAKDATRPSNQQKNNGQSVRYEWMYEFYRIRGDFAHGKLNTQQPTSWNPLEHLVLATIAFPLVIKCLLSKVHKYNLTDNDQAQIESFERFADTTDFLKPPSKQKASLDSNWKRLVDDRRNNIALNRACKEAWASLSPAQRSSLGKDPPEGTA